MGLSGSIFHVEIVSDKLLTQPLQPLVVYVLKAFAESTKEGFMVSNNRKLSSVEIEVAVLDSITNGQCFQFVSCVSGFG